MIENWSELIKKITSYEIKPIITLEFIKMYTKRSPKYPLKLAVELALDEKVALFSLFYGMQEIK